MAKLQKSIEKKEALINATITLVNNDGFHAAPMSKIAKMANVSPATIYLYFKSKQDLVNQTYLQVKNAFTAYAFETYDEKMPVEDSFKMIWFRIAEFKFRDCERGLFLAQCDNTPMIDESSRQEGIKNLKPLLDLWKKGKEQGIIKPVSDYLLYAYTVNPLSYLMMIKKRNAFVPTEENINEAYQLAWDSIKVNKTNK
ncbi:TetR/AcrR family transcriptional regulator [Cellulophaga baltica]|uniref:TetR/AcrR family transcriptional regulator n=1 Tax=Cellulophaga TaxID=104264 RepID=UPI001C0784A9|nr:MULTISPECIES: TetR/AcrR family transcriptional regulator [Cellulophaga]MBU2996267.1 TetR/AcrR family transcriptional regulator [Cellulophaga baltica]MDO6767662.1 TetR/AcrR family transcriptional regulator [Cellulophaga sp. 1_MG-2023]